MERCPICRAGLNGAETCRRCRAELATVQALERLGRHLVGSAMIRLATGDPAGAGRLLARARLVHATPAVAALSGLVKPS
jgi:hypothetical protein